jgi:peptidase M15-like protein
VSGRSWPGLVFLLLSALDGAWAQERSSFSVRFADEINPYSLFGIFALPGERVPLEVLPGDTAARYMAEASGGLLERLEPRQWRWTAPRDRGVYPIFLRDSLSGETVTLNAFVMVPAPAGPSLNGFLLGRYERRPLRNDSSYAMPRGFIEMTQINRGTLVSPHFSLEQFASKQPSGYPKYLVLREPLLLKLEALLEEARKAGIRVTTFRILSGYRTPSYNRTIGNETRYSRHVYGDAADIYVDEDGDGRMDDLDGDGRVTVADARALAAVADALPTRTGYQLLEGGLGVYPGGPVHGPFVHIDVRGNRVRWGP